jgi:TPR repeat protein
MGKKRGLILASVFIVLLGAFGLGLYVYDRACSAAASRLCWTPAGFDVAPVTPPPEKTVPAFRRHFRLAWHIWCGEECRQRAECYYHCCGGDTRIPQPGVAAPDTSSCACFPTGLPAADGERSCRGGKIGELLVTRRAAEGGDVEQQVKLAQLYEEWGGKDMATAMIWYRKAAEQGHGFAQFRMGELAEGDGSQDADCKAAMGWYEKAGSESITGTPYATHVTKARAKLADMYRRGACVAADKERALRWQALAEDAADPFETAVPQTLNAPDTFNALALADLYMKGGKSVAKNPQEAIRWYRKAAQLQKPDDARAEYELAMIYAKGDVTEQDFVKACHWYALAQRDPRYASRNICDPIEPYLSPGDLEKLYPLIGRGELPAE